MTFNNGEAKTLDHTTATFSEELVADWVGEMVPKVITIEGIAFTMSDPMVGYINEDLKISLYMEGSAEDFTDNWYAQTDPIV